MTRSTMRGRIESIEATWLSTISNPPPNPFTKDEHPELLVYTVAIAVDLTPPQVALARSGRHVKNPGTRRDPSE